MDSPDSESAGTPAVENVEQGEYVKHSTIHILVTTNGKDEESVEVPDFSCCTKSENSTEEKILTATKELLYGLHYEQVPEYLRHPYKYTGYRLGGTHKACLLSLFRLHNETVNAWTMICATLISTALFTFAMASPWLEGRDVAAFLAIWLSAVIHNPFSICYHLFQPISAQTYNRWRKADTCLIKLMSVLLCFALAYYVCDEAWQLALIVSLNGIMSLYSCWLLLRLPDGAKLDKAAQAMRLAIICLIYWSPMVWQTTREIAWGEPYGVSLSMTLTVIGSLVVSAVVYARAWPERFLHPGACDIFGGSHQIMHVLVIVAHVAEYVFLFHMQDRKLHGAGARH